MCNSSLSQHRIAQHTTDEQKKKHMKYCSLCDFKTLRSSYLNKHVKSAHEGHKYKCEHEGCDYEAVKKQTVQDHVKSFHEGVRFKCEECDFVTTKPQNMRNHKKLRHSLKTHIKTKHEPGVQFETAAVHVLELDFHSECPFSKFSET